MLDRKGVLSFLLITFSVTYLLEGLLILAGFRVTAIPAMGGQLAVAAFMWIPAVAAFITIRFVTHQKAAGILLRFGPSIKPYLATMALIPLVFVVTYLITWALGLGSPDWQLQGFYALVASTGADMSTAPNPTMLLVLILFMTLFLSPFLNGIFGLGEELGWRGFLLPRLMPLGKWKAYAILGVVWGLWHAPLVLVGFNYPGHPYLGIVLMILLTEAIGLYINEMTLRYNSAILAGWVHGVFNSQSYGIWRMLLFYNTNPILGGITGLVGIVVISILGIGTIRYFQQNEKPQQQGPSEKLTDEQAAEIVSTWTLLNP